MICYVYPGHSDFLPEELIVQLFEERRRDWGRPGKNPKAFRGALLDPFLFDVDIEDWGYADPRKLQPLVNGKGESR